MAITSGMNVDEVRNQAKLLDTHAATIKDVVAKIDGTLHQLGDSWKGNDFTEFQNWWNQQHKPALKGLADKITGLATSARYNAQAQQDVSNKA